MNKVKIEATYTEGKYWAVMISESNPHYPTYVTGYVYDNKGNELAKSEAWRGDSMVMVKEYLGNWIKNQLAFYTKQD